ncbi:MAG: tetratricopeptide repeat protein [Candidatus Riflebacteria bacterium]|nr:tetratricopeptide repeat protein [Candidatus Riflebacteria bacterium]
MRLVFNSFFLVLLALLINLPGYCNAPLLDESEDNNRFEHQPSPEAERLLKRIQALRVHDPKSDLPLLRQYVALCPWDVHHREVLADHEFEMGNYKFALKEFLALLKYVRTNYVPVWDFNILNQISIWNGIGYCYLKLHQPSKALEYYRKVGEYQENFYTHCNFARAYTQLKEYCSAACHLDSMKDWLPAHQDEISEIEAQIPKDPRRPNARSD